MIWTKIYHFAERTMERVPTPRDKEFSLQKGKYERVIERIRRKLLPRQSKLLKASMKIKSVFFVHIKMFYMRSWNYSHILQGTKDDDLEKEIEDNGDFKRNIKECIFQIESVLFTQQASEPRWRCYSEYKCQSTLSKSSKVT